MSAAFPIFLLLLPLAAAPLVFHLAFRARRAAKPVSSLLFFRRIDPRLQARRRLRQILVLALRMLAIVALLAGLAGFVWLAGGVRGGAAAVVVVLDNSGSMQGKAPDGRTCFAHAVDRTRAILDGLKAGDRAALVLTVEDPMAGLPRGLQTDVQALRAFVDQLTPTEASGPGAQAVSKALAFLQESTEPRRQLHVVTDLHRVDWEAAPSLPHVVPRGAVARVHALEVDTKGPGLVLRGVSLPEQPLPVGRLFPLKVGLFNAGGDAGRAVLAVTTDDGTVATESVHLGPGETKDVSFLLRPATPGLHWARVSAEGDVHRSGAKAGVAFTAVPDLGVVFVGPPGGFGLIPLALAPPRACSGFRIATCGLAEAAERLLSAKPVAVVAHAEDLSAQAALSVAVRRFVENGGVAFVVPRTEAPNIPEWCGAVAGRRVSAREAPAALRGVSSAAVFEDLRAPDGGVRFQGVTVSEYWPLAAKAGATPFLALENGAAQLLHRRVGRGDVYVFGFRADPEATNLVMRPAFPVLLQRAAMSGRASSDENPRVDVAGARGGPLEAAAQVFTLSGGMGDWEVKAEETLSVPRAGVYRWVSGATQEILATRGADAEAGSQTATKPAGALAGLQVRFTREGEDAFSWKDDASDVPLYGWGLLAFLGALVAESLLSTPRARAAEPAKGGRP